MNWDEYLMGMAQAAGRKSECASRKIGAVIVRDHRILSTGYNGPPAGVDPCWERWSSYSVNYLSTVSTEINENALWLEIKRGECPRKVLGFESGKGLEFCAAAHAETNAIATAARMGISVDGATMYCDCPIPCKDCTALIINSGITEVVVSEMREYSQGLNSMRLFREAGVALRGVMCGRT